jgi:hypothetical protein
MTALNIMAFPQPVIEKESLKLGMIDNISGIVCMVQGQIRIVRAGYDVHPWSSEPSPHWEHLHNDCALGRSRRDINNQIVSLNLPSLHPEKNLFQFLAEDLDMPVILKWILNNRFPELQDKAIKGPATLLREQEIVLLPENFTAL